MVSGILTGRIRSSGTIFLLTKHLKRAIFTHQIHMPMNLESFRLRTVALLNSLATIQQRFNLKMTEISRLKIHLIFSWTMASIVAEIAGKVCKSGTARAFKVINGNPMIQPVLNTNTLLLGLFIIFL